MFQNELRKVRVQMMFTQQRFALLLEVPLSTYQSWEQGAALPNFENWKKLLNFCKKHYCYKDIEKAYVNEKGVLKND